LAPPLSRVMQLEESPEDRSQHPMNCVSYAQSQKFCEFRHARLPTDIEWQWAASNGGQTKYPWGSSPPDRTRVNGCGGECPPKMRALTGHRDVRATYAGDDGFVGTAPVGSFPLGDNFLEIHDLAGNVAELVVPVTARASTGDLTAGGSFLSSDVRHMSAGLQLRRQDACLVRPGRPGTPMGCSLGIVDRTGVRDRQSQPELQRVARAHGGSP
jgi:hypothetical protein